MSATAARARTRIDLVEAGAAVADMGVLLPIIAALVITNGIDPVAALVLAGALFVGAGIFYRVPMPVQPIKAAAAIAIATGASPRVIAAAGLVLGVILLAIAVTRSARILLAMFPKTVIRGNQLGVGLLLVYAAWRLVVAQPGAHGTPLAVGLALVAAIAATERARRVPVALLLVAGGAVWSLAFGHSAAIAVGFHLPHVVAPSWHAAATAFPLLVIPQLPLTLGNAIVGTADLELEYHGARAERVTVRNLLVSCGAANLAVGVLGGSPLCHGSSGATAYQRFGARTGAVSVVAGGLLLAAGVLLGRSAIAVFSLIPPVVLASLLAFTGARHAMLVADLRGWKLAVALVMGAAGALTRNLTVGMAVGLPAYAILRASSRARASVR